MSAGSCIALSLVALQLCFAASIAQSQKVPASKPPGTVGLVDITASTGIHFDHLSAPEARYIIESMSGGVAIIDYDNDGHPGPLFRQRTQRRDVQGGDSGAQRALSQQS